MNDGRSAPLAKLLYFQFLRLLFFVYRRRVITPFAGRAHEPNDIGHNSDTLSENKSLQTPAGPFTEESG